MTKAVAAAVAAATSAFSGISLSCGVAQAQTLPPVRYDHAPDFTVGLVERSLEDVTSICRSLGAPDAMACTFKTNIATTIILPWIGPGGVSARMYSIIRRHENGHANGWPSDHPEAR